MSLQARSHATAEVLSAYLDQQLVEPEARQLEAHLEICDECHGRLEGLRKVVARLHRLDNFDPPVELEKAVIRRIALADNRDSVFDRLEGGLSVFSRHSTILPMFAVVLALAVFIYMFAVAIDQDREELIPVVFEVPATETPATETPATETPATGGPATEGTAVDGSPVDGASADGFDLAGRTLRRLDTGWVEVGVNPLAARPVRLDSEAGRQLLAQHPELQGLTGLEPPVVFEVGGESIALDW